MNNHTTLTGNLTRNPELRYTTSGRAVATFGLAVDRRYQRDGAWHDDTSYFDVTAWGDLAENTAASLTTGHRVTVTGRLEQHTWQTDQGDTRHRIDVVATDVAASMRFTPVRLTAPERTGTGEVA